ncbi:MAG: NAD+ synthase, partial [Candidatus Hadarchaeales archaeon]
VTVRRITAFIRRKVKEANARGVVVGMSGGVDSSLVALLCARALGPKRVLGIHMPDKFTDPSDSEDVKVLSRKLKIRLEVVDLEPIVRAFRVLPRLGESKIALGNLKARIRMAILYYYANLLGYLVVGTSNRSELRAGYFTKYGDGASDLLPLGSLYKTQVRELAKELGLPERIIQKVPSAGFWPGQTDEGELGISYEKLDGIYMRLDEGKSPQQIARELGVSIRTVRDIIQRERQTEHKRVPPPTP